MKKFLVVMLAVAMIFAFASTAMAADEPMKEFTDIADQPQAAINAIMKLAVLGVLEGNEGVGGPFRPADTLTRAEFAKIVCYLTDNVKQAESLESVGSKFTDVTTGNWYTGWVNAAAQSGYFIGDPGGTFRPNANITMNEVVTVALRCAGYSDKLGSSTGNTVWPGNYVNKAIAVGLLDNVTFVGSTAATRADAAIICDATLDINMVVHITQEIAYALALVQGTVDPDGFSEIYYYTNETDKELTVFETILHKAFTCTNPRVVFNLDEEVDEIGTWDYIDFSDGEYSLNLRGAHLDSNSTYVYDFDDYEVATTYYINKGFTFFDLAGMQADVVINDDDEILFVKVRTSYDYANSVYFDNGRIVADGKSYRTATMPLYRSGAPYLNNSKYNVNFTIGTGTNEIKFDKDNPVPAKIYINGDGYVYAVKNYNEYTDLEFGIFDEVDENLVAYKESSLTGDGAKFDVTKDYALIKGNKFIKAEALEEFDTVYYLGTQHGGIKTFLVIESEEGTFDDYREENSAAGLRLVINKTSTFRPVANFWYSDDGGSGWGDITTVPSTDKTSFGDAIYAMGYQFNRLAFVAANAVSTKVIGVVTDVAKAGVWDGTTYRPRIEKVTILNTEGKEETFTFHKDFRNIYNAYIGCSGTWPTVTPILENSIGGYAHPEYADAAAAQKAWDAVAGVKSTANPDFPNKGEVFEGFEEGDIVQLVLDKDDNVKRIANYAAYDETGSVKATVSSSDNRISWPGGNNYTLPSDAIVYRLRAEDDPKIVSAASILAGNFDAAKIVGFDVSSGINLKVLYVVAPTSEDFFGVITVNRYDSGGWYYMINNEKVYSDTAAGAATKEQIPVAVWYKINKDGDVVIEEVLARPVTVPDPGVDTSGVANLLTKYNAATNSVDYYAVYGKVTEYRSTNKALIIDSKNVYVGSSYLYDMINSEDNENDDLTPRDFVDKYALAVLDKSGNAIFVALYDDGKVTHYTPPATPITALTTPITGPATINDAETIASAWANPPSVPSGTGYTVSSATVTDPATLLTGTAFATGDKITVTITLTAASGYAFDTTTLTAATVGALFGVSGAGKTVTATVSASTIVVVVDYVVQ